MILIPLTDVVEFTKYMDIDCFLLYNSQDYYKMSTRALWSKKGDLNFADATGHRINYVKSRYFSAVLHNLRISSENTYYISVEYEGQYIYDDLIYFVRGDKLGLWYRGWGMICDRSVQACIVEGVPYGKFPDRVEQGRRMNKNEILRCLV